MKMVSEDHTPVIRIRENQFRLVWHSQMMTACHPPDVVRPRELAILAIERRWSIYVT